MGATGAALEPGLDLDIDTGLKESNSPGYAK